MYRTLASINVKKEEFASWNMTSFLQIQGLIDGLDHSTSRVKEIADKLRDFQFVCSQEVDGVSARILASELKVAKFGLARDGEKESVDYICVNKGQSEIKVEFLGADAHKNLSDHLLLRAKTIF